MLHMDSLSFIFHNELLNGICVRHNSYDYYFKLSMLYI